MCQWVYVTCVTSTGTQANDGGCTQCTCAWCVGICQGQRQRSAWWVVLVSWVECNISKDILKPDPFTIDSTLPSLKYTPVSMIWRGNPKKNNPPTRSSSTRQVVWGISWLQFCQRFWNFSLFWTWLCSEQSGGFRVHGALFLMWLEGMHWRII